ncbi:ATP-binding protein [Clostridioides difficile]
MRKIAYISLVIILLIFISFGSEHKHNNEEIGYRGYIEELKSQYNNNYYCILKKIEEELIDKNNSVEYIGINLLAREYFYFLSGQYENLMEKLKETEEYLAKNKMNRELLILYSLMVSKTNISEDFNASYIYSYKAEKICKYIYDYSKNKKDLSNLISIKYIRAVIALEIGMENEADRLFDEAEELRNKFNINTDDMYYYILYYYKNKNNYEEVKKYGNEIQMLREKNSPTYTNNKSWYIQVSIILANSYLMNGEIDKCIEIVKELNEEGLSSTYHAKKYDLYNTYARIYLYYGDLEKYREWLIKSYDEVKNSNLYSKKMLVVRDIIASLENDNDKEELLKWNKIYIDMTSELDKLMDTQFFINQIIDKDLENAKYNIEILNLQREILGCLIVLLSIITFIIFMLIIIEIKRRRILRDNISILEKQMVMQHNYYNGIKRYQEETRRINHDIKNHLNIINRLIIKKEYDHAKNYVNNINKKMIQDEIAIVSNNKIIDAILFNKIETCKSKNIKLDLDIKLPEKINIDDFDICVLYGNLLDNAIEACERIEDNNQEKYIKLKSIIKGDHLFINIKNTNNKNLDLKCEKLLTSKKDKDNHGIGLVNIKRTVEKYNGSMKVCCLNKCFNVSIIVNI